MANEFLIALGSNLGSDAGDPTQTLHAALAALPRHGVRLRRVSRFFATPCFPAGAGPDYVNACAAVGVAHGERDAASLMSRLHDVEQEFGRARVQRWGSRTLDLDLLAAGDTVLPDLQTHAHWRDLPPAEQSRATPQGLILPHPRMQDRAFVLVPLQDIAAGWHHPILRQDVATLCARLPTALKQEATPLF